MVDAFIHLSGRIKHVQAFSRRVALPYDIDDATVVTMEFEGGQLGYLGTVASTAPLWQIRAFGSGGWSEIVDHHRLTVTTGREQSETRTWKYHGYPCLPPVSAALEAFARDCEGGAPFPIAPDEILHGVAVLEAIVESAATGKPGCRRHTGSPSCKSDSLSRGNAPNAARYSNPPCLESTGSQS